MKEEAKTKKMTIDKLAIMMNNSFERLEEKMATKEDLTDLEKRMNTKIDTKVEELKGQIQGLDKRIDDFAETKATKIAYKEVDNRVGFIEKKLEIKK